MTSAGAIPSEENDQTASTLALLDAVGSPMIAYRNGCIVYANAAALRLTARARDSLLGTPFHEIAHPDDQAMLRNCGCARENDSDPPARCEFRVLASDGEIRWVELKSSRTECAGRPIVIGFFHDFTERRRAEAKQRAMQRLLTQIVDGQPVPAFVINSRHQITHWNKACEQITGKAATEMIGTTRQWAAFYAEERPVLADLIVDSASASQLGAYYENNFRPSAVIAGALEAEYFFPHFGDRGRWMYFTAAPLHDAAGQVIGAIETLLDVTSHHDAEDRLRAHQAQLEELVEQRTGELAEANAQLMQSEKLASIGQLAAGVAHEINNPIGYVFSNIGSLETYIGNLLEILNMYEASESAITDPTRIADLRTLREKLDIDFLREDIPMLMNESKEGITRVRKIVQSLKEFSHVDSDQEWQWSNLHEGIDATLNIVNSEIKFKADVIKEYGELPDVECLPSQLNQVFMNLLVNASQAIGDERGKIVIRTGVTGNQVWLEFSDTGSGIPEDVRNRIFEPFFTTKAVGTGTGLGLSLSYGIIQKHSGSMVVDSEVGRGSSFRITLPIRRPGDGARTD